MRKSEKITTSILIGLGSVMAVIGITYLADRAPLLTVGILLGVLLLVVIMTVYESL